MPSFSHEILVELFRSRGEIAAVLLRSRGIDVPRGRAEVGSNDLSQVVSTEYRADAVILIRDADDRVVTGVIVEVQRQIDVHKHLTWPVYVTTLRAKLGCPVILLVVTPEDTVAAWARVPIELGNHGSYLTPVVIDFADVPWIRDAAEARRLPELAVLSALAHPEVDVAATAIDAISPLPSDQRALYLDLILTMLPAALRHALETQMENYKFTSYFALRHYGEGRGDGLRIAVLALARAKLPTLTERDTAAIDAATDEALLTALVAALGNARDADAARAVLDHALA